MKMVYAKRYPSRRSYPPRRRRRTRWQNYAGAASQLAKDVRKLKSMINVEYKSFDTDIGLADIDYNGAIIELNRNSQGDTDGEHDGDSMKCINATLRFLVSHTANCFIRAIVFWDQSNSITTPAQFLDNLGGIDACQSFKDYDNRFLTKVLYDRTFNINTARQTQYNVDKVIKLHRHTQFDAGTNTIVTGALKMLFVSNLAPASGVLSAGTCRISFTDN